MGKSLAFNPAKEKSASPFVKEILSRFLQRHQNVLDRSKNTLRSYSTTLKIFFEFLEMHQSVEDQKALNLVLTGPTIRDFLREISLTLDPRSHAHHASVLRSFLRWAHSDGVLDAALEKHIESPKVGKKIIQIQDEGFVKTLAEELRKASSREEELLFQLLYGSGLRISEATHLQWKDINLDRQVVSILGKGRKRRELPITRRALELLREMSSRNQGSVRIWTQAQSSRTHRRWVDSWNRFLPETEAPRLHPHQLRHSLATHLLQRGAGLPQIQRLLGHSRLETTQNYTHLDLKDLQKIYSRARPRLKKG